MEYRENHPEASWVEIGQVFNISSQRAWEIYNNEKNKKVTEQSTTQATESKSAT